MFDVIHTKYSGDVAAFPGYAAAVNFVTKARAKGTDARSVSPGISSAHGKNVTTAVLYSRSAPGWIF
jgi:hypothetical protein